MPSNDSDTRADAEFIEMLGKTLLGVLTEEGPTPGDLAEAGMNAMSIIRVNRQGDIEIRRNRRWDVIGGLLGDFEARVREATGLDWV